jgi:outer membrane protein OmpA-like peptidoglycan-associated protein
MMRPHAGWLVGSAALVLAALSGCATVPAVVPQSVMEARAALELAKKANADLIVPEEYQTAKHLLGQLEAVVTAEQNAATVEDMALEAKINAEIAEAHSRANIAEREYQSVQQELINQQAMLVALIQKEATLKAALRQLQQSQADKAAAEAKAAEEARRAEEETRLRALAQQEADMLRKAQQIKNADVKMESRGLVINLAGKLLFDTSSSKLQPGAMSQLSQVSELLKEFPDYRVRIEGHTDSTGDLLSNNTLSQARAESVLTYLNQKGVPLDNLTAVGMGPTRPLATNKTPDGRQLNRRVEIIFEKKTETPAGK